MKNQDNKIDLLVLIVLFKNTIKDSETITSILRQELTKGFFSLKVIIWDNSPTPLSDDDMDIMVQNNINFSYIFKAKNEKLSIVYNSIIKDYNFNFILLLDQDSLFPKNYFDTLSNIVNLFPNINLFLPIIKNRNKIVSPGTLMNFKGKHWATEKIGVIKSKNVLCITSGMLIKKDYFIVNNHYFDERLSFYGIDSSFMLKFAQNNRYLYVFSTNFQHNTVLWSNPPVEIMLNRFKQLRSSWPIIFENRPLARILSSLYSIYVAFKLALKYKDIRFLIF
ncbi:glycosyltransferase [Spirosoma radiotolerans]|uniref:Glycosyltransferase 2-like domain-containing protein n=1 Tax=Spirosoma radiotolerans TaxID=1379870 RepID=A0A0E3ZVC0_9BACT|nr:hypothetical protein [Spirosoma radiotolerans]AKD56048.1 hypothetical protein SD10_15235 [Spirosoma radiotolerans]